MVTIWCSRSQYFKNGKRISRKLYDEMVQDSRIERELISDRKGRNKLWIKGEGANVYAFIYRAGEAKWES